MFEDHNVVVATVIASIVASFLSNIVSNAIGSLQEILSTIKNAIVLCFYGHSIVIKKIIYDDDRRVHEKGSINPMYVYVGQYLRSHKLLNFPHTEEHATEGYAIEKKCTYTYIHHNFDQCLVPFEGKMIVVRYRCGESNGNRKDNNLERKIDHYIISVHRSFRDKAIFLWRNALGQSREIVREDRKLLCHFEDACLLNWVNKDWYDEGISYEATNKSTTAYVDRPPNDLPPLKDRIFMDPDLKRGILKDIRFFLKSKDVYKAKRSTYMRTYLLYGPPGTGKTRMIREICEEHKLKMGVYSSIDRVHCIAGKKIDSDMKVVVLEDIDVIMRMKEKESMVVKTADTGKAVDYNGDLNWFMKFLDGSLCSHNTIVFMTSNYPELLDERLLRDGRVHYKLEMKGLTNKEEIRRLIHYELDPLTRHSKNLQLTEDEIDESVKSFASNCRTVSKISAYCQKRSALSNKTLLQIAADSDAYDESIRLKRAKLRKEPSSSCANEIEQYTMIESDTNKPL